MSFILAELKRGKEKGKDDKIQTSDEEEDAKLSYEGLL